MGIAQTGELKQLLLWFMSSPHSKTHQSVVPSALPLGEVQVPGFLPGRLTEALDGRDVGDLQSLLPLGAGLSPSIKQVGHGFVWPSLENR